MSDVARVRQAFCAITRRMRHRLMRREGYGLLRNAWWVTQTTLTHPCTTKLKLSASAGHLPSRSCDRHESRERHLQGARDGANLAPGSVVDLLTATDAVGHQQQTVRRSREQAGSRLAPCPAQRPRGAVRHRNATCSSAICWCRFPARAPPSGRTARCHRGAPNVMAGFAIYGKFAIGMLGRVIN